jgi:hypothetical protein
MEIGRPESRQPDEFREAGGRAWRAIKEGLIRSYGEYLTNRINELKRRNNLPEQATLEDIEQSDPKGFEEILREFGERYRNAGEEIIKGAIRRALEDLRLVDPQELDQESERLWKIISQQEESSGKSPEEPRNE